MAVPAGLGCLCEQVDQSIDQNQVTHSLLSSNAIKIILILSSGGRVLKLQLFLLVNTLFPICSETDDESPWNAFERPSPNGMSGIPDRSTLKLTDIGSSRHDMRKKYRYEHSHLDQVLELLKRYQIRKRMDDICEAAAINSMT